MKKRVFIIHGWGASPEVNWFPETKSELEKIGFEVIVPQMPNSQFPISEEWLAEMQTLISNPDENTFLIGHSLGGIAILHFLESLNGNQKIGGVILVAGFSETLGTIPEIENFFNIPVNYEKIKSHCDNFVAINSDNDPAVPMSRGEILRDKLNAKFIVMHNAGHINRKTGYFKLPVAVEELLRISK